MENLKKIANSIRAKIVELSHQAETPHLGSSLSCVDILVAAYWKVLKIDPKNSCDMKRDRFILSKGHAAMALYSTLAHRGFIPMDLLKGFNQPGNPLPEQPAPNCAEGVELATGSLGHGLPVGVGMALASRMTKNPYRVFVTISDGESEEGSVWEAAMFAGAQKLSNLIVIVDYNKWQATGRSNEVMALDPFAEKWKSFGWEAHDVNGHDIEALAKAMDRDPSKFDRPLALIANTTKGKGVSFMENDNNWHYRVPNADEVRKAKAELGVA